MARTNSLLQKELKYSDFTFSGQAQIGTPVFQEVMNLIKLGTDNDERRIGRKIVVKKISFQYQVGHSMYMQKGDVELVTTADATRFVQARVMIIYDRFGYDNVNILDLMDVFSLNDINSFINFDNSMNRLDVLYDKMHKLEPFTVDINTNWFFCTTADSCVDLGKFECDANLVSIYDDTNPAAPKTNTGALWFLLWSDQDTIEAWKETRIDGVIRVIYDDKQ